MSPRRAAVVLLAVALGVLQTSTRGRALFACPGSEEGGCDGGSVCCEDDAKCYTVDDAKTRCMHSCVCTAGDEVCATLGCYNAAKSKLDKCFGKTCSGNGECVDGACVCDMGFAGADCDQTECLNDCNGADHGVCREGVCECRDNWDGPDCSDPKCPLECSGHGTCKCGGEGLDRACNCECDLKWRGVGCGEPGCPSSRDDQACSGHGFCEREGTDDKHDESHPFKCRCAAGWTGPDCSEPECPTAQPGKLCSGRGECRNGECVCRPTHMGPACEFRALCGPDCERHSRKYGRCNSQGSECVCERGWAGFDCLFRAEPPKDCTSQSNCGPKQVLDRDGAVSDPANCPDGCTGPERGVCIKGACICKPGYVGPACAGLACPNGCTSSEHGTCDFDTGECKCSVGLEGSDCGERSCRPFDNPCSGHGKCNEGQCVCEPPFWGATCASKECPIGEDHLECSGKGTCGEDGRCHCPIGRGGQACERTVCPADCSGHGLCNEGRCFCSSGYHGFDCASRSCPRDCSGHGACDATTGACACDEAWTGRGCEQTVCAVDCGANGVCNPVTRECDCAPGSSGVGCQVKTLAQITDPGQASFKSTAATLRRTGASTSRAKALKSMAAIEACAGACLGTCAKRCTGPARSSASEIAECETACNTRCTKKCLSEK